MADLIPALQKVFEVEFNNKPELFLHKNAGESGYTLGGIYQEANPTQIDWAFVQKIVIACGTIERASRMLYYDIETMEKVKGVYHNKYWSPLRLQQIKSQSVADEIFVMGVVGGIKQSAKMAQRLVGVDDDGIVGNITLEAINNYNADLFDMKFDELEIKFFEELAQAKPKFKKFLNGWKSRAEYV